MGHESGTKNHAGAQGLRKPRRAERVPADEDHGRLTDDEIIGALEQNELNRAQILARKQVKSAVDTLAEIMQDGEASAAPRVSAARELLDRGYGKSSANRVATQGAGGGTVKIVVLQLSDGTQRDAQTIDVTPDLEDVDEVLAKTEGDPHDVVVQRLSE